MTKRIKTLALSFTTLIFSLLLLTPQHVSALTINTSRDCDANAVIRCGALSTSELSRKYSQAGVADIFHYFGISKANVNNMKTTAVYGVVTSNNKVMVKGKTVATNAMTAGRQNISGSTKVTHRGTTFYTRAPSVSFASSPLKAFVVMQDGKFKFAVLASCGNAVKAKPVVVKVKKVVKVEKVVTPKVISKTVIVQAPAPAPQPEELPNTGAGSIAGIGLGATAVGTIGHYLYQRRRN